MIILYAQNTSDNAISAFNGRRYREKNFCSATPEKSHTRFAIGPVNGNSIPTISRDRKSCLYGSTYALNAVRQ